jgi:hypothetical protein
VNTGQQVVASEFVENRIRELVAEAPPLPPAAFEQLQALLGSGPADIESSHAA